jgi:hypothetical protein
MNPAEVIAMVQAGSVLMTAGLATAARIRELFRSLRPDVSDADLDAIIRAVLDDAERRQIRSRLEIERAQAAIANR